MKTFHSFHKNLKEDNSITEDAMSMVLFFNCFLLPVSVALLQQYSVAYTATRLSHASGQGSMFKDLKKSFTNLINSPKDKKRGSDTDISEFEAAIRKVTSALPPSKRGYITTKINAIKASASQKNSKEIGRLVRELEDYVKTNTVSST